MQKETIFYKKNFLIYGFGKSGFASYKFLHKKNECKIRKDFNRVDLYEFLLPKVVSVVAGN